MQWLSRPFLAIFIYAKCTRTERRTLWDCLKNLSADLKDLWIVVGDFNMIVSSEERLYGCAPNSGSVEEFDTTLLDCRHLDASFEGNPFTWSDSNMFQMLDRILYNHKWLDLFFIT